MAIEFRFKNNSKLLLNPSQCAGTRHHQALVRTILAENSGDIYGYMIPRVYLRINLQIRLGILSTVFSCEQ